MCVRVCVLTTVHFSVQNSQGLERVVISGLQNGHLLSQSESFILFPRPLKADRLEYLEAGEATNVFARENEPRSQQADAINHQNQIYVG